MRLKVNFSPRFAVNSAFVFMAQTFCFCSCLEEAAGLGRGWKTTELMLTRALCAQQPSRKLKHTTGVLVFVGDEWKADGRSSIQPRAPLQRRDEFGRNGDEEQGS